MKIWLRLIVVFYLQDILENFSKQSNKKLSGKRSCNKKLALHQNRQQSVLLSKVVKSLQSDNYKTRHTLLT